MKNQILSNKFVIGGENFCNPIMSLDRKKINHHSLLDNKYNYANKYITGGGYHSLKIILEHISFELHEYCLIPSYLCPTIVDIFVKLKIKYRYYRIDNNLQIDKKFLDDNMSPSCKAILFINYFGFPNTEENNDYIKQLKKRGIIIIQDIVQTFFPKFELFGDYCFNSLRKFVPIDGSLIYSNNEINILKSSNNYYSVLKHLGRIIRYFSFTWGIDLSHSFLFLFEKAEKNYYSYEKNNISLYDKYLISKLDIEEIINQRRNNFKQLLKHFYNIALFKILPENIIPLGFPIVIENRNIVRKKLAANNIFCPIHWKLPSDISKEYFPESLLLSGKILTLPINETIKPSSFTKYIEIVRENI